MGVVIDLQQCSIEDIPEKVFLDDLVRIGVVLKNTKGQPVCNACKAITAKVTLVIFDDKSVRPVVEEANILYHLLQLDTEITLSPSKLMEFTYQKALLN